MKPKQESSGEIRTQLDSKAPPGDALGGVNLGFLQGRNDPGGHMCQSGERPKSKRGLSHVLKALQGAPLPRQGPGQRVVVQPPGSAAEENEGGDETRSIVSCHYITVLLHMAKSPHPCRAFEALTCGRLQGRFSEAEKRLKG